ncbi:hypothetical protein [Shinella sumterensis]|jgi:hypothetical protein|uniref:Uncharacterized protein n=1 Tax=Shinella sumterensis TaxID=1967501 RepID=A0AA50CRG2_9HYPH|nr:hypothetical protein [Shinella sumterensis]WLS01401.1 hypothetical protein Q9313_28805 [Shinella sumterensis]
MVDTEVEDFDPQPGAESEAERPALSAAGQWRADYRKAQHQRRLAGIQTDLFGGPAIEHLHRNAPHPLPDGWTPDYEVERFQDLTSEQQAQRLAVDPHTPWAQTTRKALTAEEKAAMIASAANWLRLGQRVRLVSAPVSIDGTTERRAGRVGVVWRLCSPVFADYVYVNLDLIGQERSEKVVFVELRDVEPIDR